MVAEEIQSAEYLTENNIVILRYIKNIQWLQISIDAFTYPVCSIVEFIGCSKDTTRRVSGVLLACSWIFPL